MARKNSDKKKTETNDHVELTAVEASQGQRVMNPRALQWVLIALFIVLAVFALWLVS
jgi:hypothetical protein